MVTESLGAPYGQERVVATSARLLENAGHRVRFLGCDVDPSWPWRDRTLIAPRLFHLHWLTPRREVEQTWSPIESFLSSEPVDLVHFIDVPEARIAAKIAALHSTLLGAHLVSPTCPAGGRQIRGGGACEKKSGWACLWHNRKYGCLGYLKSDLHRAHAIEEYLRKRRALTSTHLACVSRYIHRLAAADGWNEAHLHLVPNPVEVPSVEPIPDAPKNLIVSATRLVRLKGVDVLLRAAAQLKNPFTLWIAGDGPEKARLEGLAAELGLEARVRFLGKVEPKETSRLLRSAEIVAQANTGPETFGLALAEAGGLSRALVASDVPALNELLRHDETAILTPAGDSTALAAALDKLLSDRALRERLGRAAAARVSASYSPKAHLDSLLAAYCAVVA